MFALLQRQKEINIYGISQISWVYYLYNNLYNLHKGGNWMDLNKQKLRLRGLVL